MEAADLRKERVNQTRPLIGGRRSGTSRIRRQAVRHQDWCEVKGDRDVMDWER